MRVEGVGYVQVLGDAGVEGCLSRVLFCCVGGCGAGSCYVGASVCSLALIYLKCLKLWEGEDEESEYIRRKEPALAREHGDGYLVISSDVVHMARNIEPVLRGDGIEFLGLVELDDGDVAALLEDD